MLEQRLFRIPMQYRTLSKKDIPWRIDVNNLSVRPLKGLLLLFLDKRDDSAKTKQKQEEEFYNLSIKKILLTINGMSHQLFAAALQARNIYPELWGEKNKDMRRISNDKVWVMNRYTFEC